MINEIYKCFANVVDSIDDIRYDGNLVNTQNYILVSKHGFRIRFGFELIGGYTTFTVIGYPYIDSNVQSTREFQRMQSRFLRKKYGFFKSLFSSKQYEGYLEFFAKYVDDILKKQE
jgi:hypothetical protein